MLRIGALAFALAATFGNARAQDAQDAQEATPETAPPPALDEQARNAAMDGRNADALRLIDEFLASNPGDRAALLDRARYLGWRGDYAAAMDTLAKLPQDDADANNLRARTLAWAERRHQAVAINAPLYAETPDDYDTAWTEALAHKLGAWPQEALPALATVQRIKPDDQDSRDLAKVVRVPLFSSVSMPFSRYSDSDDIEIRNWPSAQLDLRLSDQWRLLADYTRRELSAPAAGPFAPKPLRTRSSEIARGDSSTRSRSALKPNAQSSLGSVETARRAVPTLPPGSSEERPAQPSTVV
jgi:tetratricopeptide (TPR) repeat protein